MENSELETLKIKYDQLLEQANKLAEPMIKILKSKEWVSDSDYIENLSRFNDAIEAWQEFKKIQGIE